MLLTIHDSALKKVAFIDNNKQTTLNFFNDKWTRSLESATSVFEFSVLRRKSGLTHTLNKRTSTSTSGLLSASSTKAGLISST